MTLSHAPVTMYRMLVKDDIDIFNYTTRIPSSN